MNVRYHDRFPRTLHEAFGPYEVWQPERRRRPVIDALYCIATLAIVAGIGLLLAWRG